jgi:hypothetical protein
MSRLFVKPTKGNPGQPSSNNKSSPNTSQNLPEKQSSPSKHKKKLGKTFHLASKRDASQSPGSIVVGITDIRVTEPRSKEKRSKSKDSSGSGNSKLNKTITFLLKAKSKNRKTHKDPNNQTATTAMYSNGKTHKRVHKIPRITQPQSQAQHRAYTANPETFRSKILTTDRSRNSDMSLENSGLRSTQGYNHDYFDNRVVVCSRQAIIPAVPLTERQEFLNNHLASSMGPQAKVSGRSIRSNKRTSYLGSRRFMTGSHRSKRNSIVSKLAMSREMVPREIIEEKDGELEHNDQGTTSQKHSQCFSDARWIHPQLRQLTESEANWPTVLSQRKNVEAALDRKRRAKRKELQGQRQDNVQRSKRYHVLVNKRATSVQYGKSASHYNGCVVKERKLA